VTPATEPDIRHGATIDTDVTVIGAGPVGIVMALELASDRDVTLIESGSWQPDAAVQLLGDALREDPYHGDMRLATQRSIGGASNLWGGRCVPFDPVDFDTREIVANAQWPLTYQQVAAYFQRACDWCRCGRAIFNAVDLPELADRTLVPGFVDGNLRASDLERWSLPTNFGAEFRRLLVAHPRITIITGFTCTNLRTDPSGESIHSAEARSLDGRRIAVRARDFVLTAGGIESARLLMASRDRHPGGLGNAGGHLGRWYMSHVEARIARVVWQTDPAQTIYGHERDADGVFVRRRLTFDRGFQLSEGLPNSATWLVNADISDADHGSATLSFVYLMLSSRFGGRFVAEAIRQKHLKADTSSPRAEHVANLREGWQEAALFASGFGYGRFLKRGRRLPGFFVASADNSYPLQYHGEHLPHWESRVELSTSRDALGLPRLRTHLSFDDFDITSARRALTAIDESLRDQRLGRVEWLYDDVDSAVKTQVFGGFHQSGVTRMAADPADGVVTPELRVHGLDNLHLASTGVLPTSSQANSTFLAIALGIRLADSLRGASPRQTSITR
jgi:choline dehydrogenase-like flavoprotein